MTRNPGFLRCKEERNNEGFFKVLQSVDVFSENVRALPHDFARSISDKDLSRKMKIKAQWGSSWEVGISKNPRFYFMEKTGWEKFVRDNALGHSEFITFTHKGKMCFTVKIFKQDGKEMIHPPQSAAFLASSSRIKTEQREEVNREEVVSSDFSNGGPKTAAEPNGRRTYQRKLNLGKKVVSSDFSNGGPKTAAEPNGRRTYQRKLNLGKKKVEESQKSKRTEKVVTARRDSAAASSSSVAEFTILFKRSCLIFMRIPKSVVKDQQEKTMFKIHHPDEKQSWNVVYLERFGSFSGGWRRVVKEYPIDVGDTCKFTLIEPDELLLVVSKP